MIALVSQVNRWKEAVLGRCKRVGYAETISGRRRDLRVRFRASDREVVAQAERQAVNTEVQGSAADVVKKAMARIDEQLDAAAAAAGLERPDARTGRLLLQIHDELLYEVEEAHAPRLRAIVREAMAEGWGTPLRVPLRVVLRQGPSWGSLDVVDDDETRCSASR